MYFDSLWERGTSKAPQRDRRVWNQQSETLHWLLASGKGMKQRVQCDECKRRLCLAESHEGVLPPLSPRGNYIEYIVMAIYTSQPFRFQDSLVHVRKSVSYAGGAFGISQCANAAGSVESFFLVCWLWNRWEPSQTTLIDDCTIKRCHGFASRLMLRHLNKLLLANLVWWHLTPGKTSLLRIQHDVVFAAYYEPSSTLFWNIKY